MPGSSLAERLAATGEAIRHQQQVASSLAGALADLVMETERMAAHCQTSDLVGSELSDELLQKDFSMIMPGVPEVCTGILSQSRLPTRNVSTPVKPNQPIQGKIRLAGTETRVKECAKALAARKKFQSNSRVFSDTDALKRQIRETLTEQPLNPSDLYKETGICQAIVRSSWFEAASMILVIVSSVWMAVEIDHNHSSSLHEADAIFQVVAQLLCLLFSIEIMVRIHAFRRLRDAMKDHWILFDLVLVMILVLEVWVLGTIAAIAETAIMGNGLKLTIVFRVLRLLRILRLARVVQSLPELMVIVRGLGRALRAILVVLLLIGIFIYIAAIVFKALLDGTQLGREHFPTVNTSMGTLMLDCTLSGSRGTAIMRAAWDVSPFFGILMLLFVLGSNITMLGVLTGLLVQTVKTVAEVEKEEKSIKDLICTIEDLWRLMLDNDTNNDGRIDMEEFSNMMKVTHTAKIMRDLDVDVEGLASVAAFVFEQNQGRLGRKEFLQMVLDVRNSKKATVKDHIETRKFTKALLLGTCNGTVAWSGK